MNVKAAFENSKCHYMSSSIILTNIWAPYIAKLGLEIKLVAYFSLGMPSLP